MRHSQHKYAPTKLIITTLGFIFGLFPLLSSGTAISNASMYPLAGDIALLPPQEPDPPGTLPYPLKTENDFASEEEPKSPLFMRRAGNITTTVEYDRASGQYIIYERAGGINVRPPRAMSEQEYRDYQFEQSLRQHWQQRSTEGTAGRGTGILPRLEVGGETFDRIFGSNVIEIIPQVNAELLFGINSQRSKNTRIPEDLRHTVGFDFQSQIQANVTGTIGEKLRVDINYNTEATFEFEDNIKIEYTGFEDEIIQKIEAGNVSMPLPGTLITGSHSLFGFKTELRFGRLTVTSIFSQQKGESQTIEVRGGAQTREFTIHADDYEANRHFFLSKYFRDNYNSSLENLAFIKSNINITNIEVWITNRQGNYENSRDIIAFVDLGENQDNISSDHIFAGDGPRDGAPYNDRNNLYRMMLEQYSGIRSIANINSELAAIMDAEGSRFGSGKHFAVIENARLLSSNEYTLNQSLGYISLNMSLNADEILAVTYEYTIGDEVYTVGELSSKSGVDAPDALIAKLIKGTNLSPIMPTWDLMMKNIYNIGAFQVSSQDFYLDIYYNDDLTGAVLNYIPHRRGEEANQIAEQPLLQVLNLDNLNTNLDPGSDGLFDFVPGITIRPGSGRIIFPVLEPFGNYLADQIGNPDIAERYIYQELYDSTLTRARQVAEKNKFTIEGTYRSESGSEIPLNAPNVPRGGVTVTAGGVPLVEGEHFIVDYIMGTVRIIDPGYMESGIPIQISVESQSLFNFQTKTLMGSHFNYKFSDNFNVGATILNLTERPHTTKVGFGNEAISNTIWGLNASYRTEVPALTKAVDMLPFIETKATSTIDIDSEFAHFIPGHSRAIGSAGTVYIDDFESGKISVSLLEPYPWKLASTPQGQFDWFPEGNLIDSLDYGFKRALLAWYRIDHLFLRNNPSLTPNHIRNDPNTQSCHFVREIQEKEIFPNKSRAQGTPTTIHTLNMAYYPNERGPYNFTIDRLTSEGLLRDPENSWGGMMRPVPTQAIDFETANIEHIEFWMMDPFVYDSDKTGGDLLINLGDVSEDILRDGRKFFEHGLPTSDVITNVDSTIWGYVPAVQSLVAAFDTDPDARKYQDVGLNGLSSERERIFFSDYLNAVEQIVTDDEIFRERFDSDPANDNYIYSRSPIHDENRVGILERYKRINMTEGNHPVSQPNQDYSTASPDERPDSEDINNDNTMNPNESYYQYRISLRPEDLEVGQNFITDQVTRTIVFRNGDSSEVSWYQFKVPINDYERSVGPIQDFKSMRFMRMMLRNFSDTVFLRFATLELVRGEWRKYNRALMQGQEGMPEADVPVGAFDVSVVNIEENNVREPVNYVLPPGLTRETDPYQSQIVDLNEQSMELKVVDLADGDARAVYKSMNMDIRHYKRMMMDIHAEEIPGMPLDHRELTLFVRMGSDYANNYYEYEIPLVLTPPGTYNDKREDHRERVWPRENLLDIDLEQFQDVKLARNDAMRRPGSQVGMGSVYSMEDNGNTIKVCGNPSLSNVRVFMIGVRNPAYSNNTYDPSDDGLPKSGAVWVNELRVSQIKETGGWAANTRMAARLADFGMVTVAGSTMTPGFGSLESKVSDRSTDNFYQYDANTTLQLGQFIPDNKVNIPLFLGYSESFANPKYNPIDPDVPLSRALENAADREERDSIRYVSQDYTRRKSLNLTNVRLNKQDGPPRAYDVSNVAVSYAFSEQLSRDVRTEHRIQRSVRSGMTYNYNTRPQNVRPLQGVEWLSNPYLRIIRDFNFNYYPSQVAFQTELSRSYLEQQLRNINNPDLILTPSYSKDFYWNRNYSLNWDLSQALRFDFNARNTARIDEPDGMVDRRRDPDGYSEWRREVWSEIQGFGRNTLYDHQFNLTYNVPINKIPLFNWVSSSARYSGNYKWEGGRIAPEVENMPTFNHGNRIQNSNTIQLTGQANFATLYNKVNYLQKVNQKFDQLARGVQRERRMIPVTYEQTRVLLREDLPRTITHDLGTRDITVEVYDEDGELVEDVEVNVRSDARVRLRSPIEVQNGRVVVSGEVAERENIPLFIADGMLRLMMGVRNFSVAYSETNGSLIPGFKPESQYLGMSHDNAFAPGFPFVAGWQADPFGELGQDNRYGWITTDATLASPMLLTNSKNLTLRSTVEPIPFLRVTISGNRTFSENFEYNRKLQNEVFDGFSQRPITSGNFSISIITIGTAFEKSNSDNDYNSEVFNQFIRNRTTISRRLSTTRLDADENYSPNSYNPELQPNGLNDGFFNGYGPLSQQVLLPAFLSAYTNKSADNASLEYFPRIPMPNWQVSYDGLSKINPFKRVLRTLTLTHQYRSTQNIGSYRSNNEFYQVGDDGIGFVRDGLSNMRDAQGINFLPKYDIANISINEQFSPLFGVDMGWINSLTTRVETRNSRSVALSMANNQVTEVTNWEYIIGAGYRFENLPFQIGTAAGDERTVQSDLRLRIDFSIRNTHTVIRRFADDKIDPLIENGNGNENDTGTNGDDAETGEENDTETGNGDNGTNGGGGNGPIVSEVDGVTITSQPTAGQRTFSVGTSADYTVSEQVTVRLFFDRVVNTPATSLSFPTANTSFGFSIRFTLVQ